jgi:hypothetical protein
LEDNLGNAGTSAMSISNVSLMRLSSIMILLVFGDTEIKLSKTKLTLTVTLNLSGLNLNIIRDLLKPSMLSHTLTDFELVTPSSTSSRRIFLEPHVNWEYTSDGVDTGKTLKTWHTIN